MSPEKMIRMANQIAIFFHSQNDPDRAGRVAEHLRDYWSPEMRAQLTDYAAGSGEGLDDLVREAARRL